MLKKTGLRAGGRDLRRDPVHVGLRRLAVEVDAEDVASRPGEGEGRAFSESGGGPEDEGPRAVCHGPEC